MKLYEYNYTGGFYEINTGPGLSPGDPFGNPWWIAAAVGILITIIALIYY
jgi:hypothetical protein